MSMGVLGWNIARAAEPCCRCLRREMLAARACAAKGIAHQSRPPALGRSAAMRLQSNDQGQQITMSSVISGGQRLAPLDSS